MSDTLIISYLMLFALILALPVLLFFFLFPNFLQKKDPKNFSPIIGAASIIIGITIGFWRIYLEFDKINPKFSFTPEFSFTTITFLNTFLTSAGLVALINFVNKLIDIYKEKNQEKRESYQAREQNVKDFLEFNQRCLVKLQLIMIKNHSSDLIDSFNEDFLPRMLKYELINDIQIKEYIDTILKFKSDCKNLSEKDIKLIETLIENIKQVNENAKYALSISEKYIKGGNYDKAIEQLEQKKILTGSLNGKNIASKTLPPSTNSEI